MAVLDETIVNHALSLPSDMRAALVDRLLESLNVASQEDVDRAWAEEAERRIGEVERGTVKTIPGEDVFAKIRKRFSK